MRIMTMNIWGDYFGNEVETRFSGIYAAAVKYSPDILGLQEMTESWYKSDLLQKLTDYRAVAFEENFVPLLFKKDKFDLLECGYEQYNDTPDPSKGITWAVLKEKETDKIIAAFNTHFWWMERNAADDELRRQNAEQLYNRMMLVKKLYGADIVAFGDLNSREDSLSIQYLESVGLYTSYKLTDKFSKNSSWHRNPERGEDGLYHGKTTDEDMSVSLDHILLEKGKLCVLEQRVVEDQYILDATDHSPVYIDIE